MKSPHTKNTLLQAAKSQTTKRSLQESIFSSTRKKLKNKKFPPLQKNKTPQLHNPRQTNSLADYEFTQIGTTTGYGRRRASANMVLPKAWLAEYYETILLNLSSGKSVER